MKKTLVLLFTVLAALMLLLPCAAESMTEYPVSSLGMYISIPDTWWVVYQDMDENDSVLNEFSFGYAELMDILEESGSYMIASDGSGTLSITTTDIDPSVGKLYNGFSGVFTEILLEQMRTSLEERGMEVSKTDIYASPAGSLIELDYVAPDKNYMTFGALTENNIVCLTFAFDKDAPGTGSAEAVFRQIVDTIRFSSAEDDADSGSLPQIPSDGSGLSAIPVTPNLTDRTSGPAAVSSVLPPASELSFSADGILTGYTGTDPDVILPDSVRIIEYGAFKGNEALESVVIPEGVLVIGPHAFSDCPNLKTVYIPSTVVNICSFAFANDPALKDLTLADGIRFIGNYAVSNTGLESAAIPGSVLSIAGGAFYGNKELRQVTLGEGIRSIGADAFSSCEALRSVTIPGSVTEIGDSAFWGCDVLTDVSFGEGTLYIGDYAFQACDSLASVTLPDSLIYPGIGNFDYNTTVTVGRGTPAEEWCRLNNMDCTAR